MKLSFLKLYSTKYLKLFFISLLIFIPSNVLAQELTNITAVDAKTDGDDGFTQLGGARGVAIFSVDEFLIKNEILNISCTTLDSTTNEIPEWIKIDAGRWAEGAISEDNFVSGIKYLVSNGIIKIVCD